MEMNQWRFRKVMVQDYTLIDIPTDAKDVQLITSEETYMNYDSTTGQNVPLTQTVHYVIWLEKQIG